MSKTWSELGSYQEEFALKISQLIIWAFENGIRVRKADAYRDKRVHGDWGIKKGYGRGYSVHKLKLAQDLWVTNDEDHVRLHDQWDKMGGAPRIAKDMNHYSFEWNGHR